MKLKCKLDPWAFAPMKAYDDDGGFDLCAGQSQLIRAKDCAVFDTGVHIQIPKGYAGLLVSKSGLNVKHGLTSTGLIDAGYIGSIAVKLYNNGDHDYLVERGDKISQLMIVPILTAELVQVDTLEETERGNNGFGSTGR